MEDETTIYTDYEKQQAMLAFQNRYKTDQNIRIDRDD